MVPYLLEVLLLEEYDLGVFVGEKPGLGMRGHSIVKVFISNDLTLIALE